MPAAASTNIFVFNSNVGYRPQPNECIYCRECEIIFLFLLYFRGNKLLLHFFFDGSKILM